ncbi:MAG: metal transporter [Desulfobacteraceae bacterium]|nr:metal transporter [Desulfobacteraceae bacterium]
MNQWNSGIKLFAFKEQINYLMSHMKFSVNQSNAVANLFTSISQYNTDFIFPFLVSTEYFRDIEIERIINEPPLDSYNSYMELLKFNLDLYSKMASGSMNALNEYNEKELITGFQSLYKKIFDPGDESYDEFLKRQSEMLHVLASLYPQAILDIEPEFGFHFEKNKNIKIAETDRFFLYQIMPTDKKIKIDNSCKPVLMLPPYVLGPNVLAFLPRENKSYAHFFANMGIPTYIRINKDIHTTPAFQVLTMEDDALDTRFFCEKIKLKHGKMITLNGYCQGGFSAVCNILSDKLDGLVDGLITCVSPMDGTRSKRLHGFLNSLPTRFNNLVYGTKMLPNGNKIADGNLMGWVYRLKSIEEEGPMVYLIRDLFMVTPKKNKPVKISKTAAALNYWLKYERTDIPLSVAKMSFDSYTIPVKDDGTLPVKLFGKKLNFKKIKEKKIPWLVCYGEDDQLVEKEAALAPMDFLDIEVTPFPKGHLAIATSFSHPDSEYALDKTFPNNNCRGPVKFHLDLNDQINKKKL